MMKRHSLEKYGIVRDLKQTLIALYPLLVKLNFAVITDEERKEAEMHYLSNEYEKGNSNSTVQVTNWNSSQGIRDY